MIFAGYRQIDEIVSYYGLAGAFVHPAMVDQWGLVVNEAMAAGLPVLVSRTSGAAEDLVDDGGNGFVFDPTDSSAIAERMRYIAAPGTDRGAMGKLSRERVAPWSLERFADGLWSAVTVVGDGAQRSLPLRVRCLVWANQRAPRLILNWRSVEP